MLFKDFIPVTDELMNESAAAKGSKKSFAVEQLVTDLLLEDENYDFVEDKDLREFSVANYTKFNICLLYTSPSPRDLSTSRMPSSA